MGNGSDFSRTRKQSTSPSNQNCCRKLDSRDWYLTRELNYGYSCALEGWQNSSRVLVHAESYHSGYRLVILGFVIVAALIIMSAASLGIIQTAIAKGTPYQAGYDHGCSDAKCCSPQDT